jgi:inner membrane protein
MGAVDNVTHTLVGLIIGESAAAYSGCCQQGLPLSTRRAALLTVAVIGSNCPDLDLLVSLHGSSAGDLDYLLWHRGYTHTVIGCVALALLLYAATSLVLRLRHLTPSRAERMLLLGTAFSATALHLAMDWLNSYGVHPFWPADDHWRYGDSVFIVEPLYCVAAAPLWWGLRRAASRLLFAGAMLGAVILGLVTGMMSGLSCFLLAAGFLLLCAGGPRLSSRHAAGLSTILALAVTGAFVATGREAARRAGELARADFPQDRLIDRALTAHPANPLCWDLLLLERREERYVARHAVLSLAPAWLGWHGCPLAKAVPHAAPLTPVAAQNSASVEWLGETVLEISALKRLVTATCEAAAFMLFARAPFIATDPALLGDLRFDHGRDGASFAVPLGGEPRTCERAAPWIAPRVELLER